MDICGFFRKAFSSSLKVVINAGVKAVTGPVEDISGTARDVTGIRKELVETKLAQFKVEELESLIQKATLEDIKGYDPKTRIIEVAEARERAHSARIFQARLKDRTFELLMLLMYVWFWRRDRISTVLIGLLAPFSECRRMGRRRGRGVQESGRGYGTRTRRKREQDAGAGRR